VPLDSALGRHDDPRLALSLAKSRQWVGRGINHWDMLCHPTVYAHLRDWFVPALRRRSTAGEAIRIHPGAGPRAPAVLAVAGHHTAPTSQLAVPRDALTKALTGKMSREIVV